MKCQCGIEIKDHPANACLDAVFAEVVMRFRRRTITTSLGTFKIYYDDEIKREWPIEKWSPSTNISHAMQGVEKYLGEVNFQFVWQKPFKEWKVIVWSDTESGEVMIFAKQLELAITHALILWVGEKGKKNG